MEGVFIMGLVFMGLGIIGLSLVIIFKKKIDHFYDNIEGLSEEHARYYKNGVIIMLPIFFIVVGLITAYQGKYHDDVTFFNIFDNPVFGIIVIAYGLLTLITRFTKLKYKMFAKLSVMENNYGKIKGNAIHIFAYTIMPIIFGIIVILKYLHII